MKKEKIREIKVNKISHNEYENEKIPDSARKSLFTMIIIMAGFAIFSATIWTGAEIAASFNLGTLILITIVGNLLLTAYIATLAYIGGEEGLSTHSLNKRVWGKKGFYLPSSISLLAQLGWFGVGVMMFAGPIMSISGIESGSTTYWIVEYTIIIVSGGLMISTAFLGVKALKWVSIVAVPSVLVFGFVMMILSITSSAGATWNPVIDNTGDMKFSYAVGLVFATFVSGGTLAPDFVRWAKNGKHAAISVIVSFFVMSSLMLIFGAFAYYGTGSKDLSDALYIMGLAPIAIFVLGANIWTTNDNGLYTQGLAASSMTGIEKKWNIITLGIIGTLLAPVFNCYFFGFLNLLNLMLPGIGTLLIINAFWFKEDRSEENVSWIPIVSWALGLIVGFGINQINALEFILPLYVMIFTAISYIILHYIEIAVKKEKEIENE